MIYQLVIEIPENIYHQIVNLDTMPSEEKLRDIFKNATPLQAHLDTIYKAILEALIPKPKPKDESQTIIIPNYKQWWNNGKEKKE